MTYDGGLFVRSVEGKNDLAQRRDAIDEAFELGRRAAEPNQR
jgi:hypothetical protein